MRGNAYSKRRRHGCRRGTTDAIPEYRALFVKAFDDENAVNASNLGRALAAFERSLLANNSPFDRYMGGDRNAMTAIQIQGMRPIERIGCRIAQRPDVFRLMSRMFSACRTMGSSRNRIAANQDEPTRFERHRCEISPSPLPTCIAEHSNA